MLNTFIFSRIREKSSPIAALIYFDASRDLVCSVNPTTTAMHIADIHAGNARPSSFKTYVQILITSNTLTLFKQHSHAPSPASPDTATTSSSTPTPTQC